MPKQRKPSRGGKRPGAGRPAKRPPGLITTSVDLTAQERDHLRGLAGSIQAGMVRLVRESMQKEPNEENGNESD